MDKNIYESFAISERALNERFNYITDIEGIKIYDSRHAIEEFERHYPNLSINIFIRTIKKGLRKIKKRYNFELDHYMIISHKYKLRIPLELTVNKDNPDINVGIIPTTLSPQEIININYYLQRNKLFTGFEEIILD